VGNAQVARLLAQRQAAPEEEEALAQPMRDPALQREAAPEEEEDPEALMQASPEVGLQGGPVSSSTATQIDAARGGGAPLDAGMRSKMEGSFGTSFEGVRVHADERAQQLNHSISARAFTTGSDIFLGQGASSGDHSLMAHELTHVVQQRSMSMGGPMSVGPAGDSYEQQADSMAVNVAAGSTPAQREPNEES